MINGIRIVEEISVQPAQIKRGDKGAPLCIVQAVETAEP
jgi:citrate lyase gamma subunit